MQDDDDNTQQLSSAAQRASLPHPAPATMGISLWGILKSSIGKDLTKLTLPATVNEPLSALQVLSEDLAQRDFMVSATQSALPAARMLWLALFACTPVNAQAPRTRKPFNPLLGETFEWLAPGQDHRLLVEQVCAARVQCDEYSVRACMCSAQRTSSLALRRVLKHL